MTRQTIVRRVLLLVAVHAESHGVIDDALGDRHVRHVAVARGAVHLRADVRRVIEADVRFRIEAVHALPRNLDALVGVRRHLFDERLARRNLTVADHACLDAGDAGDRSSFHGLVTVGALRLLLDVRLVRERERLLRTGMRVEEMARRFARTAVRSREHRIRHLRLRAARREAERERDHHGSRKGLRYGNAPTGADAHTRSARLQACQSRVHRYFARLRRKLTTFQTSVSDILLLYPFMSIFGPAPSRMTRKISPSVDPRSHFASVRSDGCVPSGAMGPLPFASAPWQKRQFLVNSSLPFAIDSGDAGTAFFIFLPASLPPGF